MTGLIPIVIEPYPDELLYSWVLRLANANELSFNLFVESYFTNQTICGGKVPTDIRYGYPNFHDALGCSLDMLELYFKLSTTQFELSFYQKKYHTKVFNNLFREESNLNIVNSPFIKNPKVCLECMKEDLEKYGEHYIHRSHQLSGVTVCHKHHSSLKTLNQTNKIYSFDNISDETYKITKADCQYAEYAHLLLQNGLSSNQEDIFIVISNKVSETAGKEISKQELADYIAKLLNNSKKGKDFLNNDKHFYAQDTITILSNLFPNVNDFLAFVPPFNMATKQHCPHCNRDYYINHQAINDGWGCTYCDNKNETELLKRLVQKIGEDKFIFKDLLLGKSKKLIVTHKDSEKEFSTNLMKFLFKDASFRFTNIMTKKEAEERMTKYKGFELLEFSGVSNPAKIRHSLCGEIMEFDKFNHFERNPVCRHCELHHYFSLEYFKQQVKELVGDEYEVLEQLDYKSFGRNIVKIKHNKCGKIEEYSSYDFLNGRRCSDCKLSISEGDLSVALEKHSAERYTILGHRHHYVKILDRHKSEEFMLKRPLLLQELLRPTPSPIIELKTQATEIETTTLWSTYFKLCIEYKTEFGNLYLNRKDKYKEMPLGFWCDTQRCLYNKGELEEEKIQKLKDIGFVFDGKFYLWTKRFEEYKDFINTTGRIAPKHGEIHNGNKVGSWFFTQRFHKLKGKLSDEQITLLLEFNPKFFDELPKGKQ